MSAHKNQDRPWSVPEVFRVIQSSERSIAQRLAKFCRVGLVVAAGPDTFAFAPEGKHAPFALELCHTYETRRVTIVEMIYSRTSDRPKEPVPAQAGFGRHAPQNQPHADHRAPVLDFLRDPAFQVWQSHQRDHVRSD